MFWGVSKNRFNALSIAVAAASLGMLAVPASAATTFTGSGSSSIVAGNGGFTDTAIPVGKFTDTITFLSPGAGTSTVDVLYLKVTAGITSLTAKLTGVAITLSAIFPGSKTNAGEISLKSVAGHTNALVIRGISNGASASYSGTTAFAAVP